MPSSGVLCERVDQPIDTRSRNAGKLTAKLQATLQTRRTNLLQASRRSPSFSAASPRFLRCSRRIRLQRKQQFVVAEHSRCGNASFTASATSQWPGHHAGRPYLSPGLAVWTMRAFRNLPSQWSCEMHDELCVNRWIVATCNQSRRPRRKMTLGFPDPVRAFTLVREQVDSDKTGLQRRTTQH